MKIDQDIHQIALTQEIDMTLEKDEIREEGVTIYTALEMNIHPLDQKENEKMRKGYPIIPQNLSSMSLVATFQPQKRNELNCENMPIKCHGKTNNAKIRTNLFCFECYYMYNEVQT